MRIVILYRELHEPENYSVGRRLSPSRPNHEPRQHYQENVVSLCIPFSLIWEDLSCIAFHRSSELRCKYVTICRADSGICLVPSCIPSIPASHAQRRATVIVSKQSPSRQAFDNRSPMAWRRSFLSRHFIVVVASGRIVQVKCESWRVGWVIGVRQ